MDGDIPLNPVAGWTVSQVKAYDAMFLRFDFLTNQLQPISEANRSPNFLLTLAQAEELAMVLTRAVQKLRTDAFQAAPGPRH